MAFHVLDITVFLNNTNMPAYTETTYHKTTVSYQKLILRLHHPRLNIVCADAAFAICVDK